MNNYPRIGVGVLIIHQNKVLLSQRKNSHGAGSWCLPGGHLEFGESIEQCAIRETHEEAGIIINDIKHLCFINCIFKNENKHYVTLFVRAEYQSGTPLQKEPEKTSVWQWFDLHNLPTPLFLPIQLLIEQYPELLLQLQTKGTLHGSTQL